MHAVAQRIGRKCRDIHLPKTLINGGPDSRNRVGVEAVHDDVVIIPTARLQDEDLGDSTILAQGARHHFAIHFCEMRERARRVELDRTLRFPLRGYWDATLVNQTVVVVEQSSDDRAIERLRGFYPQARSEEHTSELQSLRHLV